MLATLALCLVTHLEPSHFAGALTDGETAPAAERADLSTVPVADLTPEQLTAEMNRLDKYRTEFIGPTVLSGVGAVVLIIGGVFGIIGIVYAFLPSIIGGMTGSAISALTLVGYVLIGFGAAAIIAGGVLLAVGLTRLFPALARRRDAMQRRDEIQKRLDGADPANSPPPVPPGVDTMRDAPLPSILLATF